MVNGIYPLINAYYSYPSAANINNEGRTGAGSEGSTSAFEGYTGSTSQTQKDGDGGHQVIRNPGQSTKKQAGRESSPAECETCNSRKYQDGSDENVSFKSATHISPNAAASKVRSHEQEHVSNAYKKAAQNNGKVLSCNVAIHTAVCPECGRTYVSGGTTSTQIRYYNEENPYQKEMKSSDAANKYLGMNVDIAC